tara:strand:- start:1507 stop:1827 length:321 start_codon:yes stop_codon:yes gene_type:complete
MHWICSLLGVPKTFTKGKYMRRQTNQHQTNIEKESKHRTEGLIKQTLIISTSWSTPLSPGKRGCPKSSSAITHPADHMSRRERKRRREEEEERGRGGRKEERKSQH